MATPIDRRSFLKISALTGLAANASMSLADNPKAEVRVTAGLAEQSFKSLIFLSALLDFV